MAMELPTTRDDVLPSSYRDCFACGEDNPSGLHLVGIRREGDVIKATLRSKPAFQGFPGVLHGGIAAAALDEVMGYACRMLHGTWAATAKFELRYRKGAPDEGELAVEGGVDEASGRRFRTWGRLLLPEGDVAVEATALFLPVPAEVLARFEASVAS